MFLLLSSTGVLEELVGASEVQGLRALHVFKGRVPSAAQLHTVLITLDESRCKLRDFR